MLLSSMHPPARLLVALARLGAPQPLLVLQPITNLRILQAPACRCSAAARVFQDDLPAAAPSGGSHEAPALPDRTALLAKARIASCESAQTLFAVALTTLAHLEKLRMAGSTAKQRINALHTGVVRPFAGHVCEHFLALAACLHNTGPVWQALYRVLCSQLACCALQASKKRRLDEVCAERFPQHSRNVVQSWIAQGKVTVNARVVVKAGAPVASDASIVINADVPKFVCRCCPRWFSIPLQVPARYDDCLVVTASRYVWQALSTNVFPPVSSEV